MFNLRNTVRNKLSHLGRKGLTLTELLAVVSILGIVTIVIAPDVVKLTSKTRNTLTDIQDSTKGVLTQFLNENKDIKPVTVPFGSTVTLEPAIPSISIPQISPGNKLIVTIYYFDSKDGSVHSSLYEYDGTGSPVVYRIEK